MLVKFTSPWFAPTESTVRDALQTTSGYLYDKGTHEVPDELHDKLPKSATIIEMFPTETTIEPSTDLKDYDVERADADVLKEYLEDVDEELKVKQNRMAVARAAKKAKASRSKE